MVGLGSQMGVGKESDIYLVTSPSPGLGSGSAAEAAANGTSGLTPSTNPTNTPMENSKPVQSILKIHRLGRTSFRSLARNRAYHGNRQHCSWQYLSRLSAQKEFQAMSALYAEGFPVPRPIGWNRHVVVMGLVPGVPLRTVGPEAFRVGRAEVLTAEEAKTERDEKIAALYDAILELALRLAEVGCIHGDFNEFNILVENVPEPEDEGPDGQADPKMSGTFASEAGVHAAPAIRAPHSSASPGSSASPASPTPRPRERPGREAKPLIPHLIDFPQITSFSHPQARSYFERDIACIRAFFRKRYGFEATDDGPLYEEAQERLKVGEKRRAAATAKNDGEMGKRLDVQIEAMGYSKKMARELEEYYSAQREDGFGGGEYGEGDEGGNGSRIDEMDGSDDGVSSVGVDGDGDGDVSVMVGGEGSGRDVNAVEDLLPEGIHQDGLARDDVALTSGDKEDVVPRARKTQPDPLLSSKMAAMPVTSKPKPKTRPKAAAGWSI